VSIASKTPAWSLLSLAANGILVLTVILLLLRERGKQTIFSSASATQPSPQGQRSRHQLNYQQILELLAQEANVAAEQPPQHLTILVGDSLSQFFPPEMLPLGRSWLNQGIAGEKTSGLLERLKLFDRTQPETIFVMIGINDVIQGVGDETILANQQKIIHYLHQVHPNSQIVVESMLPHVREEPNAVTSNSRIQNLNRQLATIAASVGVNYLNLYPLFADAEGNLHPELTVDGLHLNSQGYSVWRTGLQLYSQLKLKPPTSE